MPDVTPGDPAERARARARATLARAAEGFPDDSILSSAAPALAQDVLDLDAKLDEARRQVEVLRAELDERSLDLIEARAPAVYDVRMNRRPVMITRWERYRDACNVAARSYLDQFSDGYMLYQTDAAFHAAVDLGAQVVTMLLYFHPEGPPLTDFEHLIRRVHANADAAIVEHRGQADVSELLAAGWTWFESEEHVYGKRIRFLNPPAGILFGDVS